jgi:hypothetical protein
MDLATIVRERHELASRTSGSVEITLFWDASDDSTSVEIWQPASEIRLRIAVARERALDAFYHPFTHLADASAVLPASGG